MQKLIYQWRTDPEFFLIQLTKGMLYISYEEFINYLKNCLVIPAVYNDSFEALARRYTNLRTISLSVQAGEE